MPYEGELGQAASGSSGLIAQPFEFQIPYFPTPLLDVLKSRKNPGPLLTWNVKPGDHVQWNEVVAEYDLNWEGLNTKRIAEDIRGDILRGAIKTPCNGVVKFTSRSETDVCLFAVQPLVKEEQTFEYRQRYEQITREQFDQSLHYQADPHSIHMRACEAVWVILDRTKNIDANDMINDAFNNLHSKSVYLPGQL